MAWELETGTRGIDGSPWDCKKDSRLWEEKRNSTIECDQTATKAATGDNSIIPEPTVIMTRFEYVNTPTAIAVGV
eukprot:CAMPEP_0201283198 /NCGR_PEP_ID=MMETSP1317-20130820/7906_1 /ASSEMBLY_ACC=CAM_ASM_000770 /TAXON_ID=187299 /ORGANISM="Undescribed Undescribed, Strain Undescribed" /LENGTH=74 /DNA_ID=CAMNT_0047598619 /DNA_START=208 /DNA_END=429 /DNA_ORIENTATION=+